MALKKLHVRAFVDWKSQIHNAAQKNEPRPERKNLRTAEFVTQSLAQILSDSRVADVFQVSVRLYHGWHSGLTRTENRIALDQLRIDRALPSSAITSTFDWSEMYGDISMDAEDRRRHQRLRIHYPDSMRTVRRGAVPHEKMVDTAMATDILYSARSEPESWRIVMAEDDDVVPPVFMAERWAGGRGGKTSILRRRGDVGHLALNQLVVGLP